jgi:predicted nucleic acid-binding protein
LQDRHPLSWRDALIVASASQAGCRYLLTEDLTAGHEYGGVLVVSPMATRPSSLGLA